MTAGRRAEAQLYLGDAAEVMRRHIATHSVDMVYADPPFDTGKVWTGRAGTFDDRWSPSESSERGWRLLHAHSPTGAAVASAACATASRSAYLGMMAELLLEVWRVLRPTGTLWLQFDDTAGAQLRILCDAIFGPDAALGTMIWRRTAGGHNLSKGFARVHDTIAVYRRSRVALWHLWRIRKSIGDPLDPDNPVLVGGILGADDGLQLAATSKQRVGYPTQKPVALISRFIETATLPGSLVLDPTCGSGSSLVAAIGLGRRAIGIDASEAAIAAAHARLEPPPLSPPSRRSTAPKESACPHRS